MEIVKKEDSKLSYFDKFIPTVPEELKVWNSLSKNFTEDLINFEFIELPKIFTVIEESGLGAIKVTNLTETGIINFLRILNTGKPSEVVTNLIQNIKDKTYQYPAGLDKETSEGVCLLLEALKQKVTTAYIPCSGIFPVVDFYLEDKEFISVKFEAKQSQIAHRSSIAPWFTKLNLDSNSEDYLKSLLKEKTKPEIIENWKKAFEDISKSRLQKFKSYFEANIETKELPEEKVRNSELKLNEEVPDILSKYEELTPGFKEWFAYKVLIDLKFASTKETNWQSQFYKNIFTEIQGLSDYRKIQESQLLNPTDLFFLGGVKTNGKGFEYWDLSLNLMDYLAIYCINNTKAKDLSSLLVRLYYKSLIYGIKDSLITRKVTILEEGGHFEEILSDNSGECLKTFSGIETASIAGASISFGWDYNILHKVLGSNITWEEAWSKRLVKLGYYRIAAGNILVTSQRKDSYIDFESLVDKVYLETPETFFTKVGYTKEGDYWVKDSLKLSKDSEGAYMLTEGKNVLWEKSLFFNQVRHKLKPPVVEKKSLASILKRKR